MKAVQFYLSLARRYALKAAHSADRDADTERHQRIMSALCSIDDALDPNRPLTEEVRELMEETPNA